MDAELKALGHSKFLGQGPPADQRPPTGWRPQAQGAAPDPFFRKQALAGAGPISASSLLFEQKPSLDSSGVVLGEGGWCLESRREPEPSAPALSPPQVTAPLARPPPLSRLRHRCGGGGFSPHCPGGDQGGQGTGARAQPGGAAQLEKGSLRPPTSESGVG